MEEGNSSTSSSSCGEHAAFFLPPMSATSTPALPCSWQLQPEPHLLRRLLHPRPPLHHGDHFLRHPLLEQGARLL